MPTLRELEVDLVYEGPGSEILRKFVSPVLETAVQYDRLTGYFSIEALMAVAQGIEGLWRRGGRMRLVLGAHQVPKSLIEATLLKGDWADVVVAALRERLLAQASTLKDEALRDRVATVAWMMREGLLDVRVAAPLDRERMRVAAGIFHTKLLLFKDSRDDWVSAVGSPNETVLGFSVNYEHLTVHRSWLAGQGEYVEAHRRRFSEIWEGSDPNLSVRELDEDFARELLERLGRAPERPQPGKSFAGKSIGAEVLRVIRESPAYAPLNLGKMVPFAHQERVFIDALSRWPVRVILADEVGLGKTLEAGMLISHLIRFGTVRRVAVLAPAGLTRQWQEELYNHFGLDFWVLDSQTRTFQTLRGDVKSATMGDCPLGEGTPDLVIVSAQLARGRRGKKGLLLGNDWRPDLVLLDEAHACRVRPDLNGKPRPTRLYRMMKELAPRVPHLVLMTATPVQMHVQEYHSLLGLLGLPGRWGDLEMYERGLGLMAGSADQLDLRSCQFILDAVAESRASYRLNSELPAQLRGSIEGVRSGTNLTERSTHYIKAHSHRSALLDAFVANHPAQLLTIRNTRAVLQRFGYSFPERDFLAPALSPNKEIREFYGQVEAYLRDVYGKVEEALYPDRPIRMGFAKTSYYQRLASSLNSARITLRRRHSTVSAVLQGNNEADSVDRFYCGNEDDQTELPFDEGRRTEGRDASQREALKRAAQIERGYLEDLLGLLDRIQSLEGESDPKIAYAVDFIGEHLADEKILVFSRFTDTLQGCIDAFLKRFPPDVLPGHALYTGQETWICEDGIRTPAGKTAIRKALEDGRIRVVFCSDAASEGLNLQAARVLINIDVPWNPARLEQRIGRVARLGQVAKQVLIVNLWYPDSIEARMYTRLIQRRELYELAVGSAPDIVADSIEEEISGRLGAPVRVVGRDALEGLQGIRDQSQVKALTKVWELGREPVSGSEAMRQELAAILIQCFKNSGCEAREEGPGTYAVRWKGREIGFEVAAGGEDSLSLLHEAFEILEGARLRGTDGKGTIGVLKMDGTPMLFGILTEKELRLIRPDALPKLLRWILEGCPFDVEGCGRNWEWPLPPGKQDDFVEEIFSLCRWLPRTTQMTPLVESDVSRGRPLPRRECALEFTPLGA